MYILLIIFFANGNDNMQVEFENRTACVEAKMRLENSRINAKLF